VATPGAKSFTVCSICQDRDGLSTVLAVDLILVFDQRRLVERRTRAELLKLG